MIWPPPLPDWALRGTSTPGRGERSGTATAEGSGAAKTGKAKGVATAAGWSSKAAPWTRETGEGGDSTGKLPRSSSGTSNNGPTPSAGGGASSSSSASSADFAVTPEQEAEIYTESSTRQVSLTFALPGWGDTGKSRGRPTAQQLYDFTSDINQEASGANQSRERTTKNKKFSQPFAIPSSTEISSQLQPVVAATSCASNSLPPRQPSHAAVIGGCSPSPQQAPASTGGISNNAELGRDVRAPYHSVDQEYLHRLLPPGVQRAAPPSGMTSLQHSSSTVGVLNSAAWPPSALPLTGRTIRETQTGRRRSPALSASDFSNNGINNHTFWPPRNLRRPATSPSAIYINHSNASTFPHRSSLAPAGGRDSCSKEAVFNAMTSTSAISIGGRAGRAAAASGAFRVRKLSPPPTSAIVHHSAPPSRTSSSNSLGGLMASWQIDNKCYDLEDKVFKQRRRSASLSRHPQTSGGANTLMTTATATATTHSSAGGRLRALPLDHVPVSQLVAPATVSVCERLDGGVGGREGFRGHRTTSPLSAAACAGTSSGAVAIMHEDIRHHHGNPISSSFRHKENVHIWPITSTSSNASTASVTDSLSAPHHHAGAVSPLLALHLSPSLRPAELLRSADIAQLKQCSTVVAPSSPCRSSPLAGPPSTPSFSRPSPPTRSHAEGPSDAAPSSLTGAGSPRSITASSFSASRLCETTANLHPFQQHSRPTSSAVSWKNGREGSTSTTAPCGSSSRFSNLSKPSESVRWSQSPSSASAATVTPLSKNAEKPLENSRPLLSSLFRLSSRPPACVPSASLTETTTRTTTSASSAQHFMAISRRFQSPFDGSQPTSVPQYPHYHRPQSSSYTQDNKPRHHFPHHHHHHHHHHHQEIYPHETEAQQQHQEEGCLASSATPNSRSTTRLPSPPPFIPRENGPTLFRQPKLPSAPASHHRTSDGHPSLATSAVTPKLSSYDSPPHGSSTSSSGINWTHAIGCRRKDPVVAGEWQQVVPSRRGTPTASSAASSCSSSSPSLPPQTFMGNQSGTAPIDRFAQRSVNSYHLHERAQTDSSQESTASSAIPEALMGRRPPSPRQPLVKLSTFSSPYTTSATSLLSPGTPKVHDTPAFSIDSFVNPTFVQIVTSTHPTRSPYSGNSRHTNINADNLRRDGALPRGLFFPRKQQQQDFQTHQQEQRQNLSSPLPLTHVKAPAHVQAPASGIEPQAIVFDDSCTFSHRSAPTQHVALPWARLPPASNSTYDSNQPPHQTRTRQLPALPSGFLSSSFATPIDSTTSTFPRAEALGPSQAVTDTPEFGQQSPPFPLRRRIDSPSQSLALTTDLMLEYKNASRSRVSSSIPALPPPFFSTTASICGFSASVQTPYCRGTSANDSDSAPINPSSRNYHQTNSGQYHPTADVTSEPRAERQLKALHSFGPVVDGGRSRFPSVGDRQQKFPSAKVDDDDEDEDSRPDEVAEEFSSSGTSSSSSSSLSSSSSSSSSSAPFTDGRDGALGTSSCKGSSPAAERNGRACAPTSDGGSQDDSHDLDDGIMSLKAAKRQPAAGRSEAKESIAVEEERVGGCEDVKPPVELFELKADEKNNKRVCLVRKEEAFPKSPNSARPGNYPTSSIEEVVCGAANGQKPNNSDIVSPEIQDGEGQQCATDFCQQASRGGGAYLGDAPHGDNQSSGSGSRDSELASPIQGEGNEVSSVDGGKLKGTTASSISVKVNELNLSPRTTRRRRVMTEWPRGGRRVAAESPPDTTSDRQTQSDAIAENDDHSMADTVDDEESLSDGSSTIFRSPSRERSTLCGGAELVAAARSRRRRHCLDEEEAVGGGDGVSYMSFTVDVQRLSLWDVGRVRKRRTNGGVKRRKKFGSRTGRSRIRFWSKCDSNEIDDLVGQRVVPWACSGPDADAGAAIHGGRGGVENTGEAAALVARDGASGPTVTNVQRGGVRGKEAVCLHLHCDHMNFRSFAKNSDAASDVGNRFAVDAHVRMTCDSDDDETGNHAQREDDHGSQHRVGPSSPGHQIQRKRSTRIDASNRSPSRFATRNANATFSLFHPARQVFSRTKSRTRSPRMGSPCAASASLVSTSSPSHSQTSRWRIAPFGGSVQAPMLLPGGSSSPERKWGSPMTSAFLPSPARRQRDLSSVVDNATELRGCAAPSQPLSVLRSVSSCLSSSSTTKQGGNDFDGGRVGEASSDAPRESADTGTKIPCHSSSNGHASWESADLSSFSKDLPNLARHEGGGRRRRNQRRGTKPLPSAVDDLHMTGARSSDNDDDDHADGFADDDNDASNDNGGTNDEASITSSGGTGTSARYCTARTDVTCRDYLTFRAPPAGSSHRGGDNRCLLKTSNHGAQQHRLLTSTTPAGEEDDDFVTAREVRWSWSASSAAGEEESNFAAVGTATADLGSSKSESYSSTQQGNSADIDNEGREIRKQSFGDGDFEQSHGQAGASVVLVTEHPVPAPAAAVLEGDADHAGKLRSPRRQIFFPSPSSSLSSRAVVGLRIPAATSSPSPVATAGGHHGRRQVLKRSITEAVFETNGATTASIPVGAGGSRAAAVGSDVGGLFTSRNPRIAVQNAIASLTKFRGGGPSASVLHEARVWQTVATLAQCKSRLRMSSLRRAPWLNGAGNAGSSQPWQPASSGPSGSTTDDGRIGGAITGTAKAAGVGGGCARLSRYVVGAEGGLRRRAGGARSRSAPPEPPMSFIFYCAKRAAALLQIDAGLLFLALSPSVPSAPYLIHQHSDKLCDSSPSRIFIRPCELTINSSAVVRSGQPSAVFDRRHRSAPPCPVSPYDAQSVVSTPSTNKSHNLYPTAFREGRAAQRTAGKFSRSQTQLPPSTQKSTPARTLSSAAIFGGLLMQPQSSGRRQRHPSQYYFSGSALPGSASTGGSYGTTGGTPQSYVVGSCSHQFFSTFHFESATSWGTCNPTGYPYSSRHNVKCALASGTQQQAVYTGPIAHSESRPSLHQTPQPRQMSPILLSQFRHASCFAGQLHSLPAAALAALSSPAVAATASKSSLVSAGTQPSTPRVGAPSAGSSGDGRVWNPLSWPCLPRSPSSPRGRRYSASVEANSSSQISSTATSGRRGYRPPRSSINSTSACDTDPAEDLSPFIVPAQDSSPGGAQGVPAKSASSSFQQHQAVQSPSSVPPLAVGSALGSAVWEPQQQRSSHLGLFHPRQPAPAIGVWPSLSQSQPMAQHHHHPRPDDSSQDLPTGPAPYFSSQKSSGGHGSENFAIATTGSESCDKSDRPTFGGGASSQIDSPDGRPEHLTSQPQPRPFSGPPPLSLALDRRRSSSGSMALLGAAAAAPAAVTAPPVSFVRVGGGIQLPKLVLPTSLSGSSVRRCISSPPEDETHGFDAAGYSQFSDDGEEFFATSDSEDGSCSDGVTENDDDEHSSEYSSPLSLRPVDATSASAAAAGGGAFGHSAHTASHATDKTARFEWRGSSRSLSPPAGGIGAMIAGGAGSGMASSRSRSRGDNPGDSGDRRGARGRLPPGDGERSWGGDTGDNCDRHEDSKRDSRGAALRSKRDSQRSRAHQNHHQTGGSVGLTLSRRQTTRQSRQRRRAAMLKKLRIKLSKFLTSSFSQESGTAERSSVLRAQPPVVEGVDLGLRHLDRKESRSRPREEPDAPSEERKVHSDSSGEEESTKDVGENSRGLRVGKEREVVVVDEDECRAGALNVTPAGDAQVRRSAVLQENEVIHCGSPGDASQLEHGGRTELCDEQDGHSGTRDESEAVIDDGNSDEFQMEEEKQRIHDVGMMSRGEAEEEEAYSESARLLGDWLYDKGVKVLAVDFDLTMSRVHSGGYVNPEADRKNVLTSLSESFNGFAHYCQEVLGMKIVCVTFSDARTVQGNPSRIAGESLVDSVLKRCSAKFHLDRVYAFWPENYQFPHQFQPLGLTAPMPGTKSFHLRQVRKDLCVRRSEVLLIDDDIVNCRNALREGYLSIQVVNGSGFDYKSLKVA